MFWPDFNKKQFCLQVLLWNGLLFGSRCEGLEESTEILIIGTPVAELATITITTTIAYKPTSAPSDPTFLGCYTQPRDGEIFGPDGRDACSDTVAPTELTIETCLKGCAVLKPPSQTGERYAFAGLRNGSECICGTQLSPDASAVPADSCRVPCAGDATLSCGGSSAIAVYSLASSGGPANDDTALLPQVGGAIDPDESGDRDDQNTGQGGDERQTGEPAVSTRVPKSLSGHTHMTPSPKTTSTRSGAAGTGRGSPTASSDASPKDGSSSAAGLFPTSAPAGAPAPPASPSTIAAITGSMSGAIVVVVALVLCFRAYRRKKQRQQLKMVLPERRGPDKQERQRPSVLSRILTGEGGKEGDVMGPDDDEDREEHNNASTSHLAPTTPGLESGSLDRPRSTTVADPPPPRSRGNERDSLYHSLMHEVLAGPAPASSPGTRDSSSSISGGSSSSVQWHNSSSSSTGTPCALPAAAHHPPGLGDRAWHRRKISTPYAPIPIPIPIPPPTAPLPPLPRPRRVVDSLGPPQKQHQKQKQDDGAGESPVLGRQVVEVGAPPVLPPIVAGERFDVRGWDGDEEEEEEEEEGVWVRTPSTVGTSILFPDEEEGGKGGDGGERK
ncbi:hypothetical protein F4775DRAFT_261189 [Biscogniauxia sp. FL1348]|nr:hypothetical protein F4775DRAFT_261189 [Biscogniauxia sp. FL1348]